MLLNIRKKYQYRAYYELFASLLHCQTLTTCGQQTKQIKRPGLKLEILIFILLISDDKKEKPIEKKKKMRHGSLHCSALYRPAQQLTATVILQGPALGLV